MPEFDVFLSHNSSDKPAVRALKAALVQRGLTVWLDEDELRPGVPWQELLEEGIRGSKSVAVLVGFDGIGPWEHEEMQAALALAVKDKRPVIAVLLPGAPSQPDLPVFLGSHTWVDLRSGLDRDGLGRLVWGITGEKPSVGPVAQAQGESLAPVSPPRPAGSEEAYEDGTNVPAGTRFVVRELRTANWYRPSESQAPPNWQQKWERLRERFERIVDECRPVACVLIQERTPAHGYNSIQAAPLTHGYTPIGSSAGLGRGMSHLLTEEWHALSGAFAIRDVNGKEICYSAGEPCAIRFGLSRQFVLYAADDHPDESRPLPEARLEELVLDATSLLYSLPAHVAVSLWQNWKSGFSREHAESKCLWLDALFELSWQGLPGSALCARRNAWHGHVSVQLVGKGLFPRLIDIYPPPLVKSIQHDHGHPMAYYSRLPDVARTSVAAIDVILERGRTPVSVSHKRFAVALSFPGEHRVFVEQVAARLSSTLGQDRVLYDRYYEAEFARPNLDTYLQRLYHDESEMIAVFLCAEYEQKEWCGLEWRAIRDLIKQRQASAVMLLRFDDTEITGLFLIDGYVSIGYRSPQDAADLILQRIRATPVPPTDDPGCVQPSAPPTAGAPSRKALTIWQEKLDFLLAEEAKTVDADQKFRLCQLIKEARAKIRENGGQA